MRRIFEPYQDFRLTCNCCAKVYREPDELQYIGRQQTAEDVDWVLDLFNCSCGSTLAHKVKKEKRNDYQNDKGGRVLPFVRPDRRG